MEPDRVPKLQIHHLLEARIAARDLRSRLLRVNLGDAPKVLRQPTQAARSAADFAEISLTQALRAAHETGAYTRGAALDELDEWLGHAAADAPKLGPDDLACLWRLFESAARHGPTFEG
jgi:hypothetical protein